MMVFSNQVGAPSWDSTKTDLDSHYYGFLKALNERKKKEREERVAKAY